MKLKKIQIPFSYTHLDVYKRQGHYFVPRYTRVVDTVESKDNINKAYNLISTSKARNEMIVDDVITCVARKQTPVILTRFKEHAKLLHDALTVSYTHLDVYKRQECNCT